MTDDIDGDTGTRGDMGADEYVTVAETIRRVHKTIIKEVKIK